MELSKDVSIRVFDLRVCDVITQSHVRNQFLVNPAAREVVDEILLLVLDQQCRIQLPLILGHFISHEFVE